MLNNEQQGSLSEKFQGFGAAPSDALWANIEGAIAEKKKRKGAFWWWLGSGLAAAFIVTYLAVNMIGADQSETMLATDQVELLDKRALPVQSTIEKIHHQTETSENIDLSYTTNEKINENSQPKEPNQVKNNLVHQDVDLTIMRELGNQFTPAVEQENQFFVEGLVNKVNLPNISLLEVDANYPNIQLLEFNDCYKFRPWEIGGHVAYYHSMNLSLGLKKETTYDPVALTGNSQESNTDEFILGQQPDNFQTVSGMAYNSNFTTLEPSTQSTVTKNFNLNFYAGRYISDRIMVNSGIGYSRSTYKTIYNNGFTVSPLTHITTLAIPVGLSLDAVKLPKFKLRPTLSLNNEFAVYEKVQTVELMPYEFPGNKTSGYSASMELSINHLFKIKPRLALDVAPSFRYYLRQNIQSQNFLIKKNSWIGGKIGLLWTL